MKTYYIYHIAGVKIGCTIDLQHRKAYNKRTWGRDIEFSVLETIEGPDTEDMWQVIGDREWELADHYGYNKGLHYKDIRIKSALVRHSNIDYTSITPYDRHNEACQEGWVTAKKKLRTLSNQQVLEIRRLYSDGGISQYKLADRFNTSRSNIQKIINRCSYREI
tara:strand:+ start:50 stop:541 length:492 start_codon:yes stop_codon:yes gene_type:complete